MSQASNPATFTERMRESELPTLDAISQTQARFSSTQVAYNYPHGLRYAATGYYGGAPANQATLPMFSQACTLMNDSILPGLERVRQEYQEHLTGSQPAELSLQQRTNLLALHYLAESFFPTFTVQPWPNPTLTGDVIGVGHDWIELAKATAAHESAISLCRESEKQLPPHLAAQLKSYLSRDDEGRSAALSDIQ